MAEDNEAQHIFENHVRAGKQLAAEIVADAHYPDGATATGHEGVSYTVHAAQGKRSLVTSDGVVLAGPGAAASDHDYFELAHARGTVLHQFRSQARETRRNSHRHGLFATARGRHAARVDAIRANRLGLRHIAGTDVDVVLYPHTQSPIGLYGELRPVMVRGQVAFHGAPEPPLFPAGGPPSEYFRRTWKPGMLSWQTHRRATPAEFRDYLRRVHPQVERALHQGSGGGIS